MLDVDVPKIFFEVSTIDVIAVVINKLGIQ